MSALFTDNKLIVFHGDTCLSLNFATRTINDRRKDIQQSFSIPFSKVDAVLRWDEEVVFFFKGMDCIKYDLSKKSVSAGYPKKILFEWKGVWLSDISDAVRIDNKVFFFRKTQYISYDIQLGKADTGYPQPIAEGWRGVWESIDGAEYLERGKVLFLKEDQIIQYDLNLGKTDARYPLKLDEFVRSYRDSSAETMG